MNNTAVSRSRTGPLRKKPWGFILVCTLPAFLLVFFFTLFPALRALVMSFTDATAMNLTENRWLGLENYQYMFHDHLFIQALGNTLKLMAVVPVVTLAVSLILAGTLDQTRIREKGVYRTIYFFPSIISMTVIAIVWSFVFHPNMGLLNNILEKLSLGSLTHAWLGEQKTALWCVAVTLVWQAAGYYMIMYIAAMGGIPGELYEAATLDGAGPIRRFISVTLPLLKDIVGITYILSLSGTINLSFVLVTIMTGGGPNGTSSVLLQYMYEQGFRNGNFGYAMAITVFTLSISILLSAASRRITRHSA